jgi:hypothetical protein
MSTRARVRTADVSLPDVSVVMAVRNVEDVVGRDVRRIAERLRSLGLSFEIVATNDGCRDTSFAVLNLLRAHIPELRLLTRDVSGRAFLRGVAEANAPVVLLIEAGRCAPPTAPLGWLLGRLQGDREAVLLRGRCLAARKLPALAALARAHGRGDAFERSFEREAQGLALEVLGQARAPRGLTAGLLAPVLGPVLGPVLRLLPRLA